MAAIRATVILRTWPPPTIEHHALLAALNESTHDPVAEPATVFQHLNEIDISFTIDPTEHLPEDALAQKVVHHAMAQVYDGPISVTLDLGGPPRPPRKIDVRSERLLHEPVI
jgi:hypothetical protein